MYGHCSTTPSPVLAILSNFMRLLDPLVYCSPLRQEQQPLLSLPESQANTPDADCPERMNDAAAQRHWTVAMEETVYVSGCTCTFCAMRSEYGDDAELICAVPHHPSRNHAPRELPSIRSVMQVLYPPSYLGTPTPFPDPPSYSQSDSPAYPVRGDESETSPLISSTAASTEGTSPSLSRPDPLARHPSVTGVPSQGTPSSRLRLVEPGPPIIDLSDVPEEPLPAYSRFDQRRPRFPAASDILGPYPSLPAISHSAR